MAVQGCCRLLSGYLFIAILVFMVAGCTEETGGSEDGRFFSSPTGNNEAQIFSTGELHGVLPGQPAQLQASESTDTGQQILAYSWSLASKPLTSNVLLTNTTSSVLSFVPDLPGVYTVDLNVILDDGRALRNVGVVIVTDDGELPGPATHEGHNTNCFNCHNETDSGTPSRKSGDHVATTNFCQACHTTASFSEIPFVNHIEVFGLCSECHNGIQAIGKSSRHVETTEECSECHNTSSFLELDLNGNFDHEGIRDGCDGCHNGISATGKHDAHIVTEFDCVGCHSTDSFIPASNFDHDGIEDGCARSGCHGDGATGKSLNHPSTSNTCETCHNTISFNLGGAFNHDVIDEEAITCEGCHDGIISIGKTTDHPNTIADCGACHNTDTFTQNYVDHTAAEVTSVRCDSCHGVGNVIGMPLPNHITPQPGQDCVDCHTPGNFATGIFDHLPAIVDPVRCDSCHNDVITASKGQNHVPTSEDCRVCHGTITFRDATVDHTNIVSGCTNCHDGNIATGKSSASPAHIPTLDDCSVCHGVALPLAFSPSTFAHVGINNNCQNCHNGDYTRSDNTILGKPRVHIPTQDDCDTCHIIGPDFTGATFDHTGIDRGCGGCHNGRFTTDGGTILGKPSISIDPGVPDDPSLHVPTEQDCYFCHSFDPGWLASGQSEFTHEEISGNCTSCHDGNYVDMGALAKTPDANDIPPGPHPVTIADCGACHTTSDVPPTFTNFFVDHTDLVNNCGSAGCHDPGSPKGIIAADPNLHSNPTNGNDCENCHNSGVSWVPAVFDHDNIGQNDVCEDCHDGSYATGKNARLDRIGLPHINTADDCRVCHNTTSFAGAQFDHTGVTGNCASCHDGQAATGKNNDHVPTNEDCNVCHRTTGFIPATFDHQGIVDNCESCHNGTFAIGKSRTHVQTNQDCGVCHSTDSFIPAGFDHTGITNNCNQSGCHDNGATGKPPTHVPTTPSDQDCAVCHTTTSFVGASWVHGSNTRGRCLDCHVTGGGATPQPSTGHFDTQGAAQCDACHTTTTWADQGTYRHQSNTDYPGDHRVGRTRCVDCHRSNSASPITYPNDPRYAPDCAGCHAGDFEREGDHIGGSNGTVAQNRNCGGSGCHRVSASGF